MLPSDEHTHALDDLLAFLGEAYVEVSGQAEALRTVVSDLQSTLSYLHSTTSSPAPVGSNAAAPGPGPLELDPFQQQQARLSSAALHARSLSSASTTLISKPTTPTQPAAGSVCASLAHAGARSTPVCTLSAAHRLSRPHATPASAAPAKRGSTRAVDQEVGIISRECLNSVRNPLPTAAAAAAPSSSPLAPPEPSAAVGSLGCSPSPQAPPSCRPTLSVSFRRALARHQEAVRAGSALRVHSPRHQQQQQQQFEQQLGQQQERQQPQPWMSNMVCPEDAVLQGALDTVSNAAAAFDSRLSEYFGPGRSVSANPGVAAAAAPAQAAAGGVGGAAATHGSSSGGQGAASGSPPGALEENQALAHGVDVAHVALVAAHTWLLQAIAKVVPQASKQAGASPAPDAPSPTHVLQLLRSLPQLQAQLATQQAALRLGANACSADGRGHASSLGSNSASTRAGSTGPSTAAAAAQWRNRFLRAAIASSGAVPCQPPCPAAPGVDAGSAAPPSIPPRRPLGVWLPDVCFMPLLHTQLRAEFGAPEPGALAAGSPASPSQPLRNPEWAVLLSEAPWLLALPTAAAQAALATAPASPPLVPQVSHLASASPAASVSHARSQMQLQLHLLHAWVESQLAAPLIPDPAHVARCVQQAEQQQQQQRQQQGARPKDPTPDLKRALAAWRLAHTFLSKNAWNKSPYVALID